MTDPADFELPPPPREWKSTSFIPFLVAPCEDFYTAYFTGIRDGDEHDTQFYSTVTITGNMLTTEIGENRRLAIHMVNHAIRTDAVISLPEPIRIKVERAKKIFDSYLNPECTCSHHKDSTCNVDHKEILK